MKKSLSAVFAVMLISCILTPFLVMAEPVQYETMASIDDVYHFPSDPLGHIWEGYTDGDEIEIYALVTGGGFDKILIQYSFCTRTGCEYPSDIEMQNVGGDLYGEALPGDYTVGASTYEASHYEGSYIRYNISVENGGIEVASYGPVKIYPAWPPVQTNVSYQISDTTPFPGQTIWVNGTTNYWNSTSQPGASEGDPPDYSKLIPVAQSDVTLILNSSYGNQTNDTGAFSFQVQAPMALGNHDVNVTVQNDTANRNVTCVSTNTTITVVPFPVVDEIGIQLSNDSVYPGQTVWVNGTAKYDYGNPIETTMAYVNLTGDQHTTSTNAAGFYSQQINAPMTPGNHQISVTVVDETYEGTKNITTTNLNVQTPVLDVTATPNSTTPGPVSTIWVNGTATYGNNQPAAGAAVNVSIGAGYYNDTVTTDVSGNFRVLVPVPDTVGTKTVNVTVEGTEYGSTFGYYETDILVTEIPIVDLETADDRLTFSEPSGLYLEGHTVTLSVNVSNKGNKDATDALVNFTSFASLEIGIGSKTIATLNYGEYTIVTLDWLAVAGNHTINATVDPQNTIEEAFENNNNASKNLFVDGDMDGDNIGDMTDPDLDGDGYDNAVDEFPLDISEWNDTDGDDIGDNADNDDDNDGVPDDEDDFPLDPTEDTDTDGDEIGDNADPDDDNDGVPDDDDPFPLDDEEWSDFDGDEIGDNADNDDDADGLDDLTEDPYPWDTDNDGLINALDDDDDGDGIPDAEDTMPLDTDNDGLRNDVDPDDDDDGVPDTLDDLPLNDKETTDTDGDGVGDNEDIDDDGDGIPDDQTTGQVDTGGGWIMALIAIIAVAVILGLVFYWLEVKKN